jgi:hypothetical protein
VRGILAASYASVGVRVSTSADRRVPAAEVEEALLRAYGEAPEVARAIVARLDVERRPDGTVRLRVHAPSASRVEIMGDFTDWVPLPLEQTEAETFEITLPIPAGVHRLNVRLNGGPRNPETATSASTADKRTFCRRHPFELVVLKLQIVISKLQTGILKLQIGVSKLGFGISKLRFVVFKLQIVVLKLGNAISKLENGCLKLRKGCLWGQPGPSKLQRRLSYQDSSDPEGYR